LASISQFWPATSRTGGARCCRPPRCGSTATPRCSPSWPARRPCLVDRLPDGLTVGIHEDAGLRYSVVDRYEQPLTCTTPDDICQLVIPPDTAMWYRAILAFLLALPLDTRIVL
jgi:hypothetical protein